MISFDFQGFTRICRSGEILLKSKEILVFSKKILIILKLVRCTLQNFALNHSGHSPKTSYKARSQYGEGFSLDIDVSTTEHSYHSQTTAMKLLTVAPNVCSELMK